MKKCQLKRLALMGIVGGFLTVQHIHADTAPDSQPQSQSNGNSGKAADDGNLGYHLMTEDELMLELSPQGAKQFKSLDAEGKKLALVVASQRCDHTNACAGLNACQDSNHSCAGKGDCKGKGKCALADKNLAVKLVADKMAKKRAQAVQ